MAKKKAVNTEETLPEPAHSLEFQKVLDLLTTNADRGLNATEVSKRHTQYGDNALDEGPGVQPGKILIHQIANALTLVRPSPPANRHRTVLKRLIQPLGAHHGHGGLLCHPVLD